MMYHYVNLDNGKVIARHIDAVKECKKGFRIAVFDSNCKWILSWIPQNKIKMKGK